MKDFLVYSGLIIAIVSTLALMVFSMRQNGKRQMVKDIPLRYEEWRANYRASRWYFTVAQLAGIVIAIIGLLI